MVKWLYICICLCYCARAGAQVKCFARVELDRSSVYVQQPFKVTYTVFTATWYTQPLQFDNLQVPDAFIIPFTSPLPGRFSDHGVEYAGVQFYYMVFPYKAGAYSVPSISITAVTPPAGSAAAQEIVLHTIPATFVVKPIPKDFPAGQDWLVASDVQLNEHWNKPLQSLKVGDVITRTVSVNASGTLPQFIPSLPQEKVSWAEVYPGKITLKDTRNDVMANGLRSQTDSWLLTKAGEFTLQGQSLRWWNPYAGRMYVRNTPPVKLTVVNNPSLGMLTTHRDSLQQTVAPPQQTKKGPRRVAGMVWYKALLLAAIALVCLWWLIRSGRWLVRKITQALQRYRQGETYSFRQFQHARQAVPARFYRWWDHRLAMPSVAGQLEKEQELATLQAWKQYQAAVYGQGIVSPVHTKTLKQVFRRYRRQQRHSKTKNNFRPPRAS